MYPSRYHQRIRDLIRLGKLDLAIREAREALRQNPEDAEAHQLLAWGLWEQGKLREAESSARRALGLAPNDPYIASTLALILTALKKYKEARRLHEQALALAPDEPEFHARYGDFLLIMHRGRSLFTGGVLKKAMLHVDTALRLDPRNVYAHLLRAYILRLERRPAEAEASVREALKILPNEAAAHEMMGDIYMARGRSREALACYRETIRLNPSSYIVEQKLLWAARERIPVLGLFFRERRPAWVFLGKKRRTLMRAWLALCMVLNTLLCIWGSWWSQDVAMAGCLGLMWALSTVVGFLWISDPLIRQAVMKGWIK